MCKRGICLPRIKVCWTRWRANTQSLLCVSPGENWNRQRSQRPDAPAPPPGRGDGRWVGSSQTGGWGPDDHVRASWDCESPLSLEIAVYLQSPAHVDLQKLCQARPSSENDIGLGRFEGLYSLSIQRNALCKCED